MSPRPKRAAARRGRPGWIAAFGVLLLLLASLSLVTWRQTRGLMVEREVREIETARAVAEAERVELTRRIENLRSRSRIVQVATDRLGMHVAGDHEMVFLPISTVSDTLAEAAP